MDYATIYVLPQKVYINTGDWYIGMDTLNQLSITET